MASINGLSVKKLKKFEGREGVCFQGDLYLGKTKIVFWSQDANGCIVDNFYMEPGFSEDMLNEEIERLNPEKTKTGVSLTGEVWRIPYNATNLLTDYLVLMEDEKLFKNALKKNCPVLFTVTDGYNVWAYPLPIEFKECGDATIRKVFEKQIAEAEKKKLFKDDKIETKIYRSLDDFKVGEPIAPTNIRREA